MYIVTLNIKGNDLKAEKVVCMTSEPLGIKELAEFYDKEWHYMTVSVRSEYDGETYNDDVVSIKMDHLALFV